MCQQRKVVIQYALGVCTVLPADVSDMIWHRQHGYALVSRHPPAGNRAILMHMALWPAAGSHERYYL
jgi:hypothetical protein